MKDQKTYNISDGLIEQMFRWMRESITIMYIHHKHPLPMTTLIFIYMETLGNAMLKSIGISKVERNRKKIKNLIKDLVTESKRDKKESEILKNKICTLVYDDSPNSETKVIEFIKTYMHELCNALDKEGLEFDKKVYIGGASKPKRIGEILGNYYRNALTHRFWMRSGTGIFKTVDERNGNIRYKYFLINRDTKRNRIFRGINIDFLFRDFINAINEYQSILMKDARERENLAKAILE